MAKVLIDVELVSHLRNHLGKPLCGSTEHTDDVSDGDVTCKECAKAALDAIEGTTKAERREWRKL